MIHLLIVSVDDHDNIVLKAPEMSVEARERVTATVLRSAVENGCNLRAVLLRFKRTSIESVRSTTAPFIVNGGGDGS